jgi:muramoyltetrapeptide carboxypeptidase
MTRRRLIRSAAALSPASLTAQAPPRALIKPRALKPGDTVGVIMPSTPVPDPDVLAMVPRTLEHFNLKFKLGRHVGKRPARFEASVQERLEDLHEMFADPSISAVFPIGGGYGSQHLLDQIDYDLIRRNPKILTGYSDITALHLAIHKRTGLVTFHSPVILSSFSEYTQEHFRRALFEPKPLGRIANPPERNPVRPQHPWRAVRPGKARGRLIGGNLTLISTTMGTPFEIDTDGCILFLEDVGEEPYSVDRMLTQLHLAGKLQSAAGIVWGECSRCAPREFRPSMASPYTLGETIENLLGRLPVPVLSGMTIGHTGDQATLPLGVMATLDAGKGELILEEPATRRD